MARALLVEDNDFNSDMLSRRLRRSGWEVVLAQDGLQGLQIASTNAFDVILMDMSLPEMDGWHLAEALKSHDKTSKTPIIALTAHAMMGDRERAIECGCDDFEAKPIEFARLLKKMSALSQRNACSS